MNRRLLEPGDVVQITPTTPSAFGGCFMLVTEAKSFGAQGFVAIPNQRGQPPASAHYRASWDEMEFIGRAAWVPRDEEPEGE